MPLDRRAFLFAAPSAGPLVAAAADAAGAASLSAGLVAAELGIEPDAARDQTDALQAAIDRAAQERALLVLPPGTLLTRPLTLRPGTRITGSGPSTRLVLAEDGPVFRARDADDLWLCDLTLDAGPASGDRLGEPAAMIDIADSARIGFDRLKITGGTNGIALERVSGSIRNCWISRLAGAAVFAMDSLGLEIVHNTIDDCADNGLLVWRSEPGDDGTIIANNRIRRIGAASGGSGEFGNGVNLFRAGGVTVSANRIEDCAYSAIRANSASNCQIAGNSCRRLGEVAIYAEFAFEGALITGNLVDDAATGIAITNFNEGGRLAVCSGNIVRNLRTRDHEDARGSGITAEADTVVTGNLIERAPTAGISIGWGPHLRDVSATSNMIRDCGIGIAVSVAEGAGSAVISGNMISHPVGSAIQAFEWAEAVSGDLAIDGADSYPNLTVFGNLRST